jgi:hypothetical protein
MGFLSKIVKKVKSVATQKNISYLGPIAAPLALTKSGRQTLVDTYGNIAKPFVSAYAPAASGVFNTVVDRFATPVNPPAQIPDGGGGSDGGGSDGGGYFAPPAESSFSGVNLWAIGAGVVGLLVVLVLLLRGKRS